jgi:adenylate kinase family enzyme
MRRIMIVGQPGSGKSTLARAIGARTDLPVVHIDTIHWQPGWVERSRDEKTRLCHEVEARDRWIFEGGHSATWENRLARADLLIWIDRPTPLRLWRVLRRTLTGLGRTRPDLPEGCPERLDTLPDFIRFIWTTRHTARTRMVSLAASAPPSCRVIRLGSRREVNDFLSGLERTRFCESVEKCAAI